jgi:hypothetical protein
VNRVTAISVPRDASNHVIIHLNHRHARKNFGWIIPEEDDDVDLPFGISGAKFRDLALGVFRESPRVKLFTIELQIRAIAE